MTNQLNKDHTSNGSNGHHDGNGGKKLHLDWTYSKAIHRQVTIESLAQSFLEALRELITHCLSPNAGGYTPSDFPQMQFSQEELDELLGEL